MTNKERVDKAISDLQDDVEAMHRDFAEERQELTEEIKRLTAERDAAIAEAKEALRQLAVMDVARR